MPIRPRLVRVKILQILRTVPSFNQMVPSFTQVATILKLGMKQGLYDQNRGQKQGDFKDNPNIGTKTKHIIYKLQIGATFEGGNLKRIV